MKYEVIELKSKYPFLGKNGCNPTVSVYLPDNLAEMGRENLKKPSVVVCPGGGYGYCSAREAEPIAMHFLSIGFNAFVLNYSVAPNRFPTQLTEVAAVMDLIHENSEFWHCDADKTAIIGFSAGGHLAAHYSTSFDIPEVRELFPNSYPVNATILSYPVITADINNSHRGSFENLLGHSPDEKETEKFSPDKNVSKKTPPAFIWHTAEDNCVPVISSILYAGALAKNNISFELHIYPYGGHGLSTADFATCNPLPENVKPTTEWLTDAKRWLKNIFGIE